MRTAVPSGRAPVAVDRRRRDTRDRLVAAAVELFRRQGPGGTGLAEVCARGGTTKGVLSHHFPGGKAELVRAAVQHNADEVTAMLDDLVARDITVGRAIRLFFEAYAELLDHDPDFGCPLAAAVVDTSHADPQVRRLTGDSFARWTATLAETLRARGWPRRHADELATTTVCAMEGAILLARAERDAGIVRETGRGLARLADAGPPA